jgi:hypothetical protein
MDDLPGDRDVPTEAMSAAGAVSGVGMDCTLAEELLEAHRAYLLLFFPHDREVGP